MKIIKDKNHFDRDTLFFSIILESIISFIYKFFLVFLIFNFLNNEINYIFDMN